MLSAAVENGRTVLRLAQNSKIQPKKSELIIHPDNIIEVISALNFSGYFNWPFTPSLYYGAEVTEINGQTPDNYLKVKINLKLS